MLIPGFTDSYSWYCCESSSSCFVACHSDFANISCTMSTSCPTHKFISCVWCCCKICYDSISVISEISCYSPMCSNTCESILCTWCCNTGSGDRMCIFSHPPVDSTIIIYIPPCVSITLSWTI